MIKYITIISLLRIIEILLKLYMSQPKEEEGGRREKRREKKRKEEKRREGKTEKERCIYI